MKKLRERFIKNSIIDFLRLKGIYCWNNATTGIYDPKKKLFRALNSRYHVKGVSDVLGVLSDGRILAIEVKTKTGRLTDEQEVFIEEIRKRNGVAFVARSVDDVIRELKKEGVFGD